MGKKYIIELPETDSEFDFASIQPYAAPDLEQVRMEAFADGYNTGFGRKVDASYQEGLSDAWDAAKKIQDTGGNLQWWIHNVTASEAIEKIRQYEQEKDRQERIEYDREEIEDVINTTMKECNVSLNEIAEVLQKMREKSNG